MSYRKQARAILLATLVAVSVMAVAPMGATAQASGTVAVSDATVTEGDTGSVDVTLNQVPEGLQTFNITLELGNGSVADIESASGEAISGNSFQIVSQSADSITVRGADIGGNVEAGAGQVTLANLNLNNTVEGASDIDVTVNTLEDDSGNAITSSTESGTLTVEAEDNGGGGDDGDDESDVDREFGSAAALEGSLVYSGQVVAVDVSGEGVSAGDDVVLRRATGSDSSTPEQTLTVNDNQRITIDTSDLQTADHFLVGGNMDRSNTEFEIVEQNIDAEIDADSVTNAGSTELTVTSDLRNNYDVTVTVPGFSEQNFADVFGVNTSDVQQNDNGQNYIVVEGAEAGNPHTLDFTGISTGNYTFDVSVTDTTAADNDTIEVTEAADAAANFESVEGVAVGDIASVNVSLTSASTATVTVGSADAGYQANVTVADNNGDGYAEFSINTYTMGGQTDAAQADAFYVAGDTDDAVTNVEIRDGSDLGKPIDNGRYRMTARTGTDASATANAITRIQLTETSGVTSQNIWTAPAADALGDFPDEATLTQDSTIANGDYVVHQIEAEGVFGILESANANNDVQALATAIQNNEIDLSVAQTDQSTQTNRDPKTLDYLTTLTNGDGTVVADADSGTIYIVIDSGAVESSRDINYGNDVFNAAVGLNGTTTDLVGEDAGDASAEFSAVEMTAELSQNTVNVTNAQNQTITGTSSAAAGTEYNIYVESMNTDGDGFIEPDNVATVNEDGELSAEVDFSDASVGDTFEVVLENSARETVDSATGNVVEQVDDTTTTTADDTTTAEPTDTTAEPTDTTAEPTDTTAEPTDTTTGGDDGGEDGGTIPGFGVGIALVAILGAALLALRE